MYGYRQKLGDDVCISLLFINKVTGCDTTSQFCTIGKGIVIEAIIKIKLNQYVEMYMPSSATHKVIEQLCKKVACFLCNRNEEEAISKLRRRIFEKEDQQC